MLIQRTYFAVLMMASLSALPVQAQDSAPSLSVEKPSQAVHVGSSFEVICSVTWAGEPDEYLVLPAELNTLDWATMRVTSLQTEIAEGAPFIKQTIKITPNRVGTFSVPNIRIPYLLGATLPAGAEPNTLALVVESFEVTVLEENSNSSLVLAVIVCSLGALLLLGIFFARRNRGEQLAEGLSPLEVVQHDLHAAKRHRLDGNYYAFYQDLARVVTRMNDGTAIEAQLLETMQRRAQEVGFQGVKLTEDEIDGDQRDIERAVVRWKEESNTCSPT
jgi:hypothetical protein